MDVLKEYEADIENYQRSYQKAGMALLSIRDGDLWVEGDYLSFEEYCDRRWDFTKQRAYQLLRAANFCLTLKESTTVDAPPTERICREVLKVRVWEEVDGKWGVDEEKTAQKQLDTWEMVSSHLNGATMTTADVRVLVDKSTGRGISSGPGIEKQKKQALAQLGKAFDKFCAIKWTDSEKRTYGRQVRDRVKGW